MKRRWVIVGTRPRNGKADIRRTWTRAGALSLLDRLEFIRAGMPDPGGKWIVGKILEEKPGEIVIRYEPRR